MTRSLIKESANNPSRLHIPDSLIREEINGKPYYYKGYKSVLRKEKKLSDIMGSSGLQALIVEILLNFLFQRMGRKKYRFFSNEVGGHIKKGTNLSFDIAVFDKKKLPLDQITPYYVSVPPKIVFEIDVKIDEEDENALSYMDTKTKILFEHGTELVIWVLTKPQKLFIARTDQQWEFISWDQDVAITENIILNLAALLKDEEDAE